MSSTDIEVYKPRQTSLEVAPDLWRIAEKLASTPFVPVALQGQPESVLACMLTGHELGLEMMQSLAKIHIIEGRPALSAEIMRAIVQHNGHEIEFVETNSTRCTIRGRRKGGEKWTEVTWAIEDAKKANLTGKGVWQRYPTAMLIARATGQLCRMMFADDLAGISYTAEEMTDGLDTVDVLGDLDAPPAAPVDLSKRRARAPKAITTKPQPADDLAPPPPAPRGDVPPLPDDEADEAELVGGATGEISGDDDVIDPPVPDLPGPAEQLASAIQDPAAAEAATVAAIDEETEWRSAEWTSGEWPVDDPPLSDKRYTGAQIIAIRLANRFDIKGNTKEARAQRIEAIARIIGRPIESSKDLTPDEIADLCKRIDATPRYPDGSSDLEQVPDILTAPELQILKDLAAADAAPSAEVDPEPAGQTTETEQLAEDPGDEAPANDPPGRPLRIVPPPNPGPEEWTGDQWRDFLGKRKVKVTETMREAQRLAGQLDPAPSIGTLDDIAGSGVAVDLLGWAEDLSLERKNK